MNPTEYNSLKKAKQVQSPKKQVAAFRKAARELGCDDSEERFKEALRQIAKRRPEAEKVKRKAR